MKPEHVDKVLNELHKRFGFNKEHWKSEFAMYHDHVFSNTVPLDTAFISFGNKAINPLLNKILGRADDWPTFSNLVNYVVTGKAHKKKWND